MFYYYIQLYALDVAGTDFDLASYLLAIINGGSLFGRLIAGWIGRRLGPMNAQTFFTVISGTLSFCLLAISSTSGVIVFSALYGLVSGPFVSLPIPIISSLSSDKTVLGTRLGMSFAFIGLGVLVGEPIAGAILGGTTQNWTGVIVWCGVVLLASASILGAARIAIGGFVLRIKR